MTLLLKQLFSFIQLLNSDKGTTSIALGITCGFILGMTPSLSIQSLVIFTLLFIFRIQIGAALISAFFFAFIAWILDPLFHSVGSQVLQIESLKGLFTTLYNMPIVPFTRFNNSIVMGSGVIAFALSPVVFFLSLKFVKQYRVQVVERFKKTKFWKVVRATGFYKWYETYKSYT